MDPADMLFLDVCIAALSAFAFSLLWPDGLGSEFGLGAFLFTNAAAQGDVWTLRFMVHAGHDINAKAWSGYSALMRAALAGKPAAIRYLLEEGADTYTWTLGSPRHETELDVAKRRVEAHKKERSRKGLSWQQRHPQNLDPKLRRLSECVELLQSPSAVRDAKAARELVANNPPKKDDSSVARGWLRLP
ncbi:hypothetical protein T484DRAFT_1837393 [Baffinella frigidus]|nr:hypothetical protein T484DRAFT_1837393 [Cryptophyta sp. CCMP2293]